MKINNIIILLGILIIVNLSLVVSQTYSVYGSSINPQFTDPRYDSNYYDGYNSYSSNNYGFDNSQCVVGEDVIVQIIPESCTPNVIRSDLLEEQNIPVFCKVRLIKINPLIDVSTIKSLHFKGNYPAGISGVSYFPARAAIKKERGSNIPELLDSQVNEDLGYLAIIISRQSSEINMPDFIEGEITATIDYSNEGIFGVGNTNLYISEMDDSEWAEKGEDNMIWNGKAYIRGESINEDEASLKIYNGQNNIQTSILLKKGQTSGDIYLEGDYCSAGMKIKLEDIQTPINSALIQINDEQTWVSEGDKFLDEKCRVTSLSSYRGGGKIKVSCSAKNGSFELSLMPGSAEFILENQNSRKISTNEKIDSEKNIYLSYLGQDKNNERYVIIVKDDFSTNEKDFLNKGVYGILEKFIQEKDPLVDDLKQSIEGLIKNQYKQRLNQEQIKEIDLKLKTVLLKEDESYFGVKLKSVSVIADKNWDVEDNEQNILAKEYYDNSIEKYEDLADFYPHEQSPSGDAYAAIGLFEAAKLSKQFQMNAKALEFFNRLIEDYPNSNVAKIAKRDVGFITKYDSSNSKTNLVINNQQYFIDLLDFKEPSKEKASVVLLIGNSRKILGVNDIESFGNEDLKQQIVLKKFDANSVSIEYKKGEENSKNYVLNLNDGREINLDGVDVRLEKINLEKQAKISILPSSKGTRTESHFFFRVYIEKRAIPLSPEMAQRMAESLIRVIERLEQIKEALGSVIRIMKSVCLTTSKLLTAQNMMNGGNEISIARTNIMTGAGGWNDKCEELVNEGKYNNLQMCFLNNDEAIEKDIQVYSEEIKKTNNIIKNHEDEEEFSKEFDVWCKSQKGGIKLPDKNENSVEFNGEEGICSWDSLTQEQKREIMTLYNVQKSSGSETLRKVTENQLGRVVLNAKNYEENNENSINPNEEDNEENLGIKITNPVGDKVTYGDIKTITSNDKSHSVYTNFNKGSKVIRVYIPKKKTFNENEIFIADESIAGKEVVVELIKIDNSDKEYRAEGKITFASNGNELSEDATDSVKKYMSLSGMNRIKQTDEQTYNNPIKNPDKIKIKYFEKAPYKGLPSEVVFDVERGWYVETNYITSGFGQPYEESGKIVNFYICNVGSNGLIEFKKNGDDICRYYNEKSGASVDFPGLTNSESQSLVNKAQKAIDDAANQYGKDKVSINGRTFESGVSFGGEAGRCTDFMSAEDCNTLFNVCDPVICPSSRCNLGGEYQVDNVVETGIVGSLVLCLPNYKEGVMIPICLTGVHAGLEGYISILKSTVDCLREAASSGRSIGICDEIRSVYICELFYKNAEQYVGALLPQLGGDVLVSVRGGGEYATIDSTWENTQGSVDSFINDYTSSSEKAFQSQSTVSIGSGFCSSFMSQTVPGTESKGTFERLTEPYSPPQYHAWFSENPMTTVTVPATSHYKVYFHIYAGSNRGASYSVYLKDLPSLSDSINSYLVDSGYISENGQVDKAKDFTAPSGFKQLCIIVNGEEICDFGQISTSFAFNSLNDAYVSEQINQEITSEEDCVAGTPSYIDTDPNPFRGSENTELYEKGIIRVCATDNPGKQDLSQKYDTTNLSSERWREVGYCGDENMKCWLDTDSLKNVIQNKGVAEAMLGQLTIEEVLGDIDYLTGREGSALANKIETNINEMTIDDNFEGDVDEIIEDLEILIEKGSNNVYRARGLYLFGKLYKKVALGILGVLDSDDLNFGDSVNEDETVKEVIIEDNYDDLHSGDADTITEDESNEFVLKENVNIILKTTMGNQIIYKYKEKRWLSSDDSYFVENAKEQGWNYIQGIRKIVEKTDFTEEIIINDKVIENKIGENDEVMINNVLNELKEN